MTEGSIAFLLVVVPIVIWVLLFVIVGDMSRNRGHSPWPWWIIALFGSPFASILLLWIYFDETENDESQCEGDTQ